MRRRGGPEALGSFRTPRAGGGSEGTSQINASFAMCRYSPLAFFLGWVGLLLAGTATVHAQDASVTPLRGRVVDAETGAPLPQANLRIAGAYTGTITNADGRYSLALDSLPVTVVVRYVGYASARRRITAASDPQQTFRLAPSTVQMEGVVVTGRGNPGETLMRRVIERKQEWWPALKRYSVEAYNRFALASDTTIAAIAESRTTAFWDADRGTREVVRSQRGTANLQDLTDASLPAATSVLNLYRDNVEVLGTRMVGVTHPDALDYYDFTLDTTRAIDGRRAFRIRVEPRSRLSATFRGTVTVLDSAYALLEARLRPTASLSTSRLLKEVDIAFAQQFSSFGGPYWLPVDFRARRRLDVQVSALVSFSDIRLRQVSRLSDYRINVPVPDSLYDADAEARAVRADSTVQFESLRSAAPDSSGGGPFVPYSQAERSAYARIDSTDTVERAFEPGGLLGWLQDLGVGGEDGISFGGDAESEESFGGDAESDEEGETGAESSGQAAASAIAFEGGQPLLRYNRVEGGHFGLRLNGRVGPLDVTGRGAYNTGPSGPTQWAYGGAVSTGLGDHTEVAARYRYGITPRYAAHSRIRPAWARFTNSLWALAGEPEYYDYFGAERMRLALRGAFAGPDLGLALQLRNERHFSVASATSYNVFGRAAAQPPNPPVQAGWLRSVALTATLGEEGLLGILPLNRLAATVEHSDAGTAGSDFDFTRVEATATAHVETFFPRRFRPNTLSLRLDAGTAVGTLPLQRFGVIEASPLPYTPYGALRTLDDRPYQGEHHAALVWEHNFRTVPFELLGWQALVDRDVGLLLHGGHGRTWIDDDTALRLRRRGVQLRTAETMHHELGLSVNGLLYDTLRLDLTKRLDAPGLSVGVSVVRFL